MTLTFNSGVGVGREVQQFLPWLPGDLGTPPSWTSLCLSLSSTKDICREPARVRAAFINIPVNWISNAFIAESAPRWGCFSWKTAAMPLHHSYYRAVGWKFVSLKLAGSVFNVSRKQALSWWAEFEKQFHVGSKKWESCVGLWLQSKKKISKIFVTNIMASFTFSQHSFQSCMSGFCVYISVNMYFNIYIHTQTPACLCAHNEIPALFKWGGLSVSNLEEGGFYRLEFLRYMRNKRLFCLWKSVVHILLWVFYS